MKTELNALHLMRYGLVVSAVILLSACGTTTQKTAVEGPQKPDAVVDAAQPAPEQVGPTRATRRASTARRVGLPSEDRFHFEFDSAELGQGSRGVLDQYAGYLAANQRQKLRMEGHTDERGTKEYNLALGKIRAEIAADYLVLKGIDRNRLVPVSFGEERPVRRGQGEQIWKVNRRVELKIQ